jgi:hypothetical protein
MMNGLVSRTPTHRWLLPPLGTEYVENLALLAEAFVTGGKI